MQIVNEKGERLYFTEEQRKALLAAAAKAPREVRSFAAS
jgi:integrase/recombinase XerD